MHTFRARCIVISQGLEPNVPLRAPIAISENQVLAFEHARFMHDRNAAAFCFGVSLRSAQLAQLASVELRYGHLNSRGLESQTQVTPAGPYFRSKGQLGSGSGLRVSGGPGTA